MTEIRSETKADYCAVETLYDLAFAPGRAALSSYRFRRGLPPITDLCLVIEDEYSAIVAAIRFWPIRIGDKEAPALLLGPIATHPIRQGEGLGGLLIAESLKRAVDLGWKRVVLVGDRPYYERFGFAPARAFLQFPAPTNPERVLARALVPDAWAGVSGMAKRWRDPCAEQEDDAERQ
jgi:predicted N-acetyltransferase YhbS